MRSKFLSLSLIILPLGLVVGAANSVQASPAQTFTISGHVTDGFGNIISGATVTLSTPNGTGPNTTVGTTTTDGNGSYSFVGLAGGNYYIDASLAGRRDTVTFSVQINNLNADSVKDLQVLFFAQFQIWVRDSSGVGIGGVCIGTDGSTLGCALGGTNSFGMINLNIGEPVTGGTKPVVFMPEKPGYLFNPPSLTSDAQLGFVHVLNFTGASTGLPISFIQFQVNPPSYVVNEGDGSVTITVTRTGDTSMPVSADYTTADTASCNQKSDYVMKAGTLNFAPGETSKSFSVLIIDNAIPEPTHTFTIQLSNPTGGASLGDQRLIGVSIVDNDSGPSAVNPIDGSSYFVREQYYDFLNRYPDQSGWNFWTGNITPCGNDPACLTVNRVNVSAAFFLSIEFQQTGYLVERIYKTAYGDTSGSSTLSGTVAVPTVRFNEFIADTQQIGQGVVVNQGNWQQQLEDNKNAFMAAFVQRQRFATAFPSTLSAAQFVDTLNSNAGNPLSLSDRFQLVSDLTNGAKTRAQVLRAVAENQNLATAEFNRALVLMQYFGYLRRNPNDSPDADYSGYDFWLQKLNQFNGNYVQAEMVKAFINADEYRHRFGP